MLYPFFELAARSPSRQKNFRQLLAMHLAVVAGALLLCGLSGGNLPLFLGQALLVSGIVEGALLIGWRLTQLPKSKFLEPLLLSPVPAPVVLLGEQLVGLTYLAFLALSSAPVLVGLAAAGLLDPVNAIVVGLHGLLWGAAVGLGLTCWAYEPDRVRKWGTRFSGALLLGYLVIGGLFGEHTLSLLSSLPGAIGLWTVDVLLFLHLNNPFSIVLFLGQANTPGLLPRLLWVESCGGAAVVFFLLRAASRLKEHYMDRHFRPIADVAGDDRGVITDRPLNWWAVKRVSEYSGQINLYLAFGASIAYSLYLIFENSWPQWLGRHVFAILEALGGVPAVCTVLFLLAAVPFAYQYGLWDSSIPDRCRRLELLLLTELDANDYAVASFAASWRRGGGYVWAAGLLLAAGWWSGRHALANVAAAGMLGLLVILLYFAVSYRVFASNRGGAALGFGLTVVLPLLTWGLGSIDAGRFAAWTPPGAIYYALFADSRDTWTPVAGAFVLGLAASAILLQLGLLHFDAELRRWFDQHSGKHA